MNSLGPIQDINKTIFDGVSLGASQTSSHINIRQIVGYAVHFYWSGGTSTTGTIIVEATNDNLDESSTTPIFSTIASSAVIAGTGDLLVNVERAMYSYIRLRWVRTAGTGGTLTAKTSSKSN